MRDKDELIGQVLGGYTLTERLGAGGMAVVYKAYQSSLNRYAAVKVLRADLSANAEFISRFKREAQAVARLSHPNIVHVYDAGLVGGHYYIAMDYVQGGSLKDLMAQGPMGVEQATSIAAQLADALDYAHRQGLVHRDVKPANVLMTHDGRPLLGDFGIARALYEVTALTRSSTAIGTPDYMAPEQFQGHNVDGRADLYALGIVLFEMIAGWPPFHASTPMATLYKQVNEMPPPLQQAAISAPAWLADIVAVSLAKQPEQRFQRAGDMAEALRRRGSGAGSVTAPVYGPPAGAGGYGPGVPTGAGGYGAGVPTGAGGYGPGMTTPGIQVGPPRYESPVPIPTAVPTMAAPIRRRRGALVPLLVGTIVILVLALLAGGLYLALGSGGGGVGQVTAAPTDRPAGQIIITVLTTSRPADTPVESTLAPTAEPTAEPTARPTAEPTAEPTAKLPTGAPPTAAPPTAEPTARPTARPTAQPAPGGPGVIADFESFGTWKRGDQPNGTFTQSNAQAHQGAYSGRLDYQFGTSGNDFVVFQQTHAIGQSTSLTAWVYGDGAGHFLNAWIKDAGGQVWQVPLGTVAHSGWQQMSGLIATGQAWPWTHISGTDNGVVDYPISFIALVLDDKPDTFNGGGVIYIDELRAEAGGAAAPPAPTSAPTAGAQAPAPTAAPAAAASGRIAYSTGGTLHLMNLGTGQDLTVAANMRQPDFQPGGGAIIVNGEGGGYDSLWTVNPGGGLNAEQTTHPDDFYPFFSPLDAGRFCFDSTRMGKNQHNLFVANLNAKKEDGGRGPLSYGGGPIIGARPVWLSDDQLVYTGCDYGFGSGANCGLYVVPSWGGVPKRILAGGLTDYATDATGTRVLVTTQRDGNWELYIVNGDGGGLRNLSANGSNDGLGTFSPDGKLVAFVSDREGRWAVWVVRPDGGGLARLFDLPARLTGTWTDERISWGP